MENKKEKKKSKILHEEVTTEGIALSDFAKSKIEDIIQGKSKNLAIDEKNSDILNQTEKTIHIKMNFKIIGDRQEALEEIAEITSGVPRKDLN